ncbi:MAG: translation initiation factor IF-3 [Acidimicrobiia bacterium]|nr:translation initiation factor IF-3 [Acidimicrobiia bacterium]
MAEPRVNDRIRAKEVRVVAPDGSQVGVKSIEEALWLAKNLEMDLVEVSPNADPPVCRLMDYGKYKYEQSVRNREARKKQTKTVVKEVKFRIKIDEHDFQTKIRQARNFLMHGHKIKAIVMFFGREITHTELGAALLDKMIAALADVSEIESEPRREGRSMNMTLIPDKAKIKALKAAEAAAVAAETEPPAVEATPEVDDVDAGTPEREPDKDEELVEVSADESESASAEQDSKQPHDGQDEQTEPQPDESEPAAEAPAPVSATEEA